MTTLSFPKIYTDERVAKMLLGKARKAHPDAKLELARKDNGWQVVFVDDAEEPSPEVKAKYDELYKAWLGAPGEIPAPTMEEAVAALKHVITADAGIPVKIIPDQIIGTSAIKHGKSQSLEAVAKMYVDDQVTSKLKKVLHSDIYPELQKAVITFPLVKDHPKTLVVLHEGKEVWLDKCRLHAINILGGGWVTVGMNLKDAKRRKFVDLKAA